MIAENINGKWICEGEEVNPYEWKIKCFHNGAWYGFESQSELSDFLSGFEIAWNLETWKAETNQLHNQLFESYYKPLQYEGEADIALTALNSAQYAQEALSLAKWRNDTYDLIEAVTEAQAQQTSPQEFINQLPVFDVSEES
jgi:hypothetical protein